MQLESQPYEAGVQRQVFVDWHLVEAGYGAKWPTGNQEGMGPWEMPHGIKLVIHKPRIDYEPIVSVDQPWEGSIHFHTTLFEDDGIYRLYYTPNYGGIEEHGHPMNAYSYMLAYAESNDGVNWVKPEVGSVDFQGSKKNNLVYGLETALDRPAAAGTVFKDPSAQPAERYKFVHRGISDGNRCVFGAVSPDGLHWEPIEEPILPNYMSDTQTIVGVRLRQRPVHRLLQGVVRQLRPRIGPAAGPADHRLRRGRGLPALARATDGRGAGYLRYSRHGHLLQRLHAVA